ncbi:MAG: YkgJ family cysteine cluster protein, partial [Promethearchaeota archaeon]
IMPHLSTMLMPDGIMQLIIKMTDLKERTSEKKSSDGDTGKSEDDGGTGDQETSQKQLVGVCPFLNEETNECSIWEYRPVSCRAFPLNYDGQNYYLADRSCPGLEAKSTMEKYILKQMKNDAMDYFEGMKLMGVTLPILQAVMMRTMQESYARILEQMSPEDMEALAKILTKTADSKKDE